MFMFQLRGLAFTYEHLDKQSDSTVTGNNLTSQPSFPEAFTQEECSLKYVLHKLTRLRV